MRGNPVTPADELDGYHVLGHHILDYWTRQAECDQDGSLAHQTLRDIRLLVACLDSGVAFQASLVEALAGTRPLDPTEDQTLKEVTP